ncbi:SpoIIE family protein phosphatase [Novosphingobium flavum]|uniref:SpoIIE family protein phosphatase n=1 Tax=Novosphingobium flavum TaxID=1778672 RepID=A0A7X1FQT4_9SPHN|nr:SpoIIE family protein phosphatase [Novosphingobium flavum]MBC2665270.1 SpoIIE family protein phosphatase [Novosphingobium flavum]
MEEHEQTQIVTRAGAIDLIRGDRLHCLELSLGEEIERRFVVGPLGVKIGRTAPSDIVIADSEISRAHCMVALLNDELLVSDLNSTNGTFVDGERVTAVRTLPVGSVLQVGNRSFKHEWRTRAEIEQSNDFDRDLHKAAAYVKALLPPPVEEGPIRVKWFYKPSAKLGGDAFGYGPLGEGKSVCYLIDVAGHGTGAAMHAVAIMNQLRQKSLPNTDMARPELVLSTLNELFQMEDHAGLYFTIWYGVYDRETRWLSFASGGHHPAYLVSADGAEFTPLHTRNVIIGAMPAMPFTQASVLVPPGASICLFSDGVFEIVDKDGLQWTIGTFIDLLRDRDAGYLGDPQKIYRAIAARAQPHTLDDDFSFVVATFE